MSKQISIELSNDFSELSRLSEFINEHKELRRLPHKVLFSLDLSLEEIVTNVISYGYEDNEEHQIIVRIHIKEGEISAVVEDDGGRFNPLESEKPNLDAPLEERPIGGLGIHLARNFMDELEYRRNENRNFLMMTKKFDSNTYR